MEKDIGTGNEYGNDKEDNFSVVEKGMRNLESSQYTEHNQLSYSILNTTRSSLELGGLERHKNYRESMKTVVTLFLCESCRVTRVLHLLSMYFVWRGDSTNRIT